MKIAVNVRFLLKGKIEGIGRVTYELMRRMVAQHPEDEFLFFYDRHLHDSFIFGENVKPIKIFPPARHPFLFYWWFEHSLPNALNKYKPDVFLSLDNFSTKKTTIKKVLMTHDIAHFHFGEQLPFWYRKYYKRFIPGMIETADRIITVSEFTKQDIIKAYQTPATKIDVVTNGCNAAFKPLLQNEQNEIRSKYTKGVDYCCYVGAVHPRKNVHRLIAAFDQFKTKTSSDLKLLICGRFAWKTGEVKQAFDDAQHQDDIIFSGYVSEEELPKILGAAKMFAYISVFEGFGLPVLEAFHCEIPVITSNVSSLPEVAGDAALLVDPNDINGIAHAISRLDQDATLRKDLIEKSRKQRSLFDWDRSADLLYAKLIEVVNAS